METQPTSESADLGDRLTVSAYRAAWMMFPAFIAGIVWLGLAGMILGTALAMEATHAAWSRDTWFGLTFGLTLGAHCGLWAGATYALAPATWRTTLTTIVAGLANPLIYSVLDWLDGPKGLHWWLFNGMVVVLPFLCGWLFARAMEGTIRLPLFPWARAAVNTERPKEPHRRLLAGAIALGFGYVTLFLLSALVTWIGVLLPLPASGIPGD